MRTAALVLSALALVACDSSETESTFVPTSVPESKPIDDLDEDEQQDFCEEAQGWARDLLEDALPQVLCNTEGISAGSLEDGSFDLAACKAARQECLDDPSSFEDPLEDQDLSCDLEEAETTCNATVGEFSDCFEESAQLVRSVAKATTCERFAAGDFPNPDDYMFSAECTALFERCGGAEEDEQTPDPVPPE